MQFIAHKFKVGSRYFSFNIHPIPTNTHQSLGLREWQQGKTIVQEDTTARPCSVMSSLWASFQVSPLNGCLLHTWVKLLSHSVALVTSVYLAVLIQWIMNCNFPCKYNNLLSFPLDLILLNRSSAGLARKIRGIHDNTLMWSTLISSLSVWTIHILPPE